MTRPSQTSELVRLILSERPTYPGHVAKDACSLVRAAKALNRLAETECGRDLTPSERKAERRHQARIAETCKRLGIRAQFCGDPRGYVVKLHFGPDQRCQPSNTWDGPEVGWGIG